jgi:hypothetical protein
VVGSTSSSLFSCNSGFTPDLKLNATNRVYTLADFLRLNMLPTMKGEDSIKCSIEVLSDGYLLQLRSSARRLLRSKCLLRCEASGGDAGTRGYDRFWCHESSTRGDNFQNFS